MENAPQWQSGLYRSRIHLKRKLSFSLALPLWRNPVWILFNIVHPVSEWIRWFGYLFCLWWECNRDAQLKDPFQNKLENGNNCMHFWHIGFRATTERFAKIHKKLESDCTRLAPCTPFGGFGCLLNVSRALRPRLHMQYGNFVEKGAVVIVCRALFNSSLMACMA